MRDSLDGLDIPVLVPAGTAIDDLTVVATGRSSIGAEPVRWEAIAVGPHDDGGGSPWTLETRVRRGWELDPDLPTVADAAVGSLLLEAIPDDVGRNELHRLVDEVHEVAGRLAANLDDPAIWARIAADVDGTRVPLWVHRRAEGFAAAADLGSCLLVMHGRSEPAAWAFALLAPETARVALRGR
jgi:hypothetical protein